MEKDYLVDPEDVISDAILESVEYCEWDEEIKIDHDKFFDEINGRTRRVRVELAFRILGSKDREEFEDLIHDLYALGSE